MDDYAELVKKYGQDFMNSPVYKKAVKKANADARLKHAEKILDEEGLYSLYMDTMPPTVGDKEE